MAVALLFNATIDKEAQSVIKLLPNRSTLNIVCRNNDKANSPLIYLGFNRFNFSI